jgi:hypothetical protein
MSLLRKPEAEEVVLEETATALRCLVCTHTRFWRRAGLLDTGVASFFGLEWANRRAVCVICENCGYIHWFLGD